ncbi:alpha/beta hydrolase [Pseudomonas turukhanskensis]|uniref:Alpha/beta hydrolase n=2 Tax=Pseudomonas turukhanskensis TaxID=1806536 RepID=A0A9W6NG09_9PSED|nr:alpha/beta fold hydrolase [Pseudomonas turukhanskensis]GLK89548.1 alpha/beta hydrolase [Pseudomonas turukhanskensis]
MPRAFVLLLLFFLPALGQAQSFTVLQRPMTLTTATGALHGTLLVPKTDKKVPVVLLIAGSGPTDRNGNNPEGGNNDSLKLLAQTLAKNGIASVRYDKRGIAASRPATPDERDLSVEKYVADAEAWSRKLRDDGRFSTLTLAGHSEGALIATLAAPTAGADAVVSIGGTGRPIDQVLKEQLRDHLPAPLLPQSLWMIDQLKAGKTVDAVPGDLQVLFRPSVQPYLMSLFRQDPVGAFAQLKMPALILQGSHDMQVEVKDAEALKAAKPDAQLVVIAGMNHVLRIVADDPKQQLASYNNPNLPLAGELTERMVAFVSGLK